ncbi:uncharacterized protein LOC129948087 [Eupeodes corollae]|uniref:uncharacterized protein LOC129948087 n=1 Tax=Eupeodes corollae TaxID=290404 RepID=UPI002493759E|nr:uncharacterized protein LOC129948087 [Eupeodes corollae]
MESAENASKEQNKCFQSVSEGNWWGNTPKDPSEIDIEISAMSSVDFQLDSAEFDSDAIQAYEIENIPPPETPPQVKTKPKTRSPDVGKSPPKRSAIKRKAKKANNINI